MSQGTLVPDLFLFLKKALCEAIASGLQLSFDILKAHKLAYNKYKLFKT